MNETTAKINASAESVASPVNGWPKCGGCLFAQRHPTELLLRTCFGHPPVAIMVNGPQGLGTSFANPIVHMDGRACSLWQPADINPDDYFYGDDEDEIEDDEDEIEDDGIPTG